MIHRRGFFKWLLGIVSGLVGIKPAKANENTEKWKPANWGWAIFLYGPGNAVNDWHAYRMSKAEVGKWQLISPSVQYFPTSIEFLRKETTVIECGEWKGQLTTKYLYQTEGWEGKPPQLIIDRLLEEYGKMPKVEYRGEDAA